MTIHIPFPDRSLGILRRQASPPRRPLRQEEELLLVCYRSGQIPESAWQEHLSEHPALRDHI